jgi:isoquinoline 1-oxidoreductase subunit alpha
MIEFEVNGQPVAYDGSPDVPLLWVLRDELKLTGTKFGCGVGLCGACTVHVNGSARRSCTARVGTLVGARVTTIEGLAPAAGGALHPVQQAWIDEDVPQCGYCQAGQIMAAVDLLSRTPRPTDSEIAEHMTNLCRCGTYVRIRNAIHRAAGNTSEALS